MFHRSTARPQNNKPNTQAQEQNLGQGQSQDHQATAQPQQKFKAQPQRKIYRPRVESSAVKKYAKSGDDLVPATSQSGYQTNYRANENAQLRSQVQQPQKRQDQAQTMAQQPINSMLDTHNNQTNYNPLNKPIENEKEVKPMNTQESLAKKNASDVADKSATPQNRDVNIPGNNFQRPGTPAAPAAVPGRPAYPGSYGAGAPANAPYGAAVADSGRKLVIGEGITMSGEIESCEHLIVQGTIEAVLKGASLLDVSQTGAFLGTVEIDEANIAGRFEGDITVKGRLTIESTGEVVGSISYKELSMEAGAVIDGSVSPIGSVNTIAKANSKKSTPAKSKKTSTDSGAELPFSDNNKSDAAQ